MSLFWLIACKVKAGESAHLKMLQDIISNSSKYAATSVATPSAVGSFNAMFLLFQSQGSLFLFCTNNTWCKAVVPNRWVATPKWVAEELLWGREQQPQ